MQKIPRKICVCAEKAVNLQANLYVNIKNTKK